MATDELLGCSNSSAGDELTLKAAEAMLNAIPSDKRVQLTSPTLPVNRESCHNSSSHSTSSTPASQMNYTFRAGQRVKAKFLQGRARWYAGVIHEVNPDGTCVVHYDDGDIETSVQPRHIKLLLDPLFDGQAALKSADAQPAGACRVKRSSSMGSASANSCDHCAPSTAGNEATLKAGGAMLNDIPSDKRVQLTCPTLPVNRESCHNSSSHSTSSTPASQMNYTFHAGQRVKAKFLQGRARWYAGVIHEVNPDGTCVVHYDDGDIETSVQPRHIKLLDPLFDGQAALKSADAQPAGACCVKRSSSMGSASANLCNVNTAMNARTALVQEKGSKLEDKSARNETCEPVLPDRLLMLLAQALEGSPALPSRSMVQHISLEVRSLRNQQLRELPSKELRAFLLLLYPLLNKDENDGEAALEATLLILSLVTVPSMPRELLVEEILESVILTTKRSYSSLVKSTTGDVSPGQFKRNPGMTEKKKNSKMSEMPAQGLLTLIIERLPALVRTGGLNDSLLLQLGQLGLSAALAEGPIPLQMGGLQVVLSVFSEYSIHRKTLLQDALETRLSLPNAATREARRNYVLSDGTRVQIFSVLCALFIQAAAKPALEDDHGVDATNEKGQGRSKSTGASANSLASEKQNPYSEVILLANQLLQMLVRRCLARSDDAESKATLEEFVQDFLQLLGKPEWPAAQIIVDRLGTLFCKWLRDRKEQASSDIKDQPARMLVLECLGNLLSTLHELRRKNAEEPLTLPEPKEVENEDAQPNDEGEDSSCFCGRGYVAQDLMLDCDQCHRWFHFECVGISPHENNLPKTWHCDNCRLRNAVQDQRKRIARLLSASLPASAPTTTMADEAHEELLVVLCSDVEVAKQLVCNYLQAAIADPFALFAQRFFLCEWHSSASARQQPTLCALYTEMNVSMDMAKRRQHSEERGVPLLTRESILAACRQLLVESGIFTKIEAILCHLLMTLQEPHPSLRAKTIKQLAAVVRADSDALKSPYVIKGVQIALQDSSIAVRDATLDLIGQFIVIRPEFADHYYETIVKKLSDPGISVRKRVIRILRELMLKQPTGKRAVNVCCRLVTRMSDDEEVHKLVVKTFQELWFVPPASDSNELTQTDVRARCDQMIGVVTAAGTTAQRSSWLQQLLDRLLVAPEGGKGSKEYIGTKRVCEQLVGQMMEDLLKCEEERADTAPRPDELMANTLQALSLFCTAQPKLLLSHVAVLPHFLKYESNHGAILYTCKILMPLLELMERPPSDLLQKLETYLTAICFRVPEDLIVVAIPALCLTVHRSSNFSFLRETLERFYEFLRRWSSSDSVTAEKQGPAAKRAMLCMGLLCRYFDFDSSSSLATYVNPEDGTHVLAGGGINAQVFDLLFGFTGESSSHGSALYASKGLGQMSVRQPELTTRCKQFIESSLRPDADLKLKRQALLNLHMMLDDDSKRQKLVQQAAPNSISSKKAGQTAAAVAETSATVSLTLQQHLQGILASLVDGRDSSVRHAALTLTSAMLREGLAHPMACLPKVIALEVDVTGCADLAKAELRKHFDRHKETLCNPSVAIDGTLSAYELQQSLPLDARAVTSCAGGSRLPHPTFLFSLLGANRRAKQLLLKALLTHLEPGNQFIKVAQCEWAPMVRRAEWIAHTLCDIRYEKEDEVLLVVHHISRHLSLAAENTLKAVGNAFGDDPGAPKSFAELEAASSEVPVDVLQQCHAAAMLNLLLMVKRHLKRQYQLSDSKCQTFDPSDSSRAVPVRIADSTPLNTRILWSCPPAPQTANKLSMEAVGVEDDEASEQSCDKSEVAVSLAMSQPIIPYMWLRALFGEDEEGFDFNLLASAKKESSTKAPRKRRRDSAGLEDTLLTTKPKARRKRKRSTGSSDNEEEAEDNDEYFHV